MHPNACPCCEDMLRGRLSRRRFIQTAAAGSAAALLSPYFAVAAEGNYEAMVLACIDPRVQAPVRRAMVRRGLSGQYSQFVIAGAAIGVVAEPFKDWHKAFWDNLATSIQLHKIKRVIALDHRDCGAAKIAYGADKVANPKIETETHRAALAEFRKQVAARHSALKVETGLMALNGRIQMFA
ncbi:MAG: twin-arginine translocation signal domain-containing protein [Alphaproteobacteria bacterium]|nr:twin-arginine translocation signal domain-containing protein [Alphaproteobacteria bacterium]